MLPPSEQRYVSEGANEAVQKERLLARALVRAVLTRSFSSDIDRLHGRNIDETAITSQCAMQILQGELITAIPKPSSCFDSWLMRLQSTTSDLALIECYCHPFRYCTDGTPPRDLDFECSPSGKPWLVSEQGKDTGGSQLHFNLTHTDRLLGTILLSILPERLLHDTKCLSMKEFETPDAAA